MQSVPVHEISSSEHQKLKVTVIPKWMMSHLLQSTATTSTIDSSEVKQFQKYVSEWWDEGGPMGPLHSMNQLRIPFIRDGLINGGAVEPSKIDTPRPLEGLSILDVGCGGGILSEPLACLGSNVTGLDASQELIEKAKLHAKEENLNNITYIASSIEEHALQNAEKYDAVVASEIVEHVRAKEEFLKACLQCLKPRGSLFITTINKTNVSNFTAIFLAENVLSLLPKGTHFFEKFIEPHKLQRILEDHNCKTELIHGMFYNPLTNKWHWCKDLSVNYALQGFKLPAHN